MFRTDFRLEVWLGRMTQEDYCFFNSSARFLLVETQIPVAKKHTAHTAVAKHNPQAYCLQAPANESTRLQTVQNNHQRKVLASSRTFSIPRFGSPKTCDMRYEEMKGFVGGVSMGCPLGRRGALNVDMSASIYQVLAYSAYHSMAMHASL